MTSLRIATLLAACLLLAGCAQPPSAAGPADTIVGQAAAAGAQVLRAANLTAATPRATTWLNGSLAATDYQVCLDSCTGGGQGHDLTALLVKGAWARLNLTLSWRDAAEDASWDAIGGHVLFLALSTGNDEVVSWRETHDAGRARIEVVLQHTGDQPIVASAQRSIQGSGAANDYSLQVDASPLAFAPYAPLALRADASATSLVARTAVGGGVVRVWDGADRLVGAFPLRAPATHIDLRNLTRGEPVLQVVDPPADLALAVAQAPAAPPPTLRPLALQWQVGDPRDVPSQGALDWQFDAARAPLAVGMYLQAKGGNGSGCLSASAPGACYATVQGNGHIRSPSGVVVEGSWNCYFCGGWGTFVGDPGVAALVAGTYSGHYEDSAAANFQVGEFQLTHVR